MIDLQMGLIGLGSTAVIGVLAYNKWQEHKHRKLAEQLLRARQADILLDEPAPAATVGESAGLDGDALVAVGTALQKPGQERVEPLLRQQPGCNDLSAARDVDTAHASSSSPSADSSARLTPANALRSSDEHANSRQALPSLYLLSAAIDYIAALEISAPAAPYRIHETQRTARARLGKPVRWVGYNEDSREWEPIVEDRDRAYRHIRVGLQLADRKGPLRDADLSVFHVAMQDLATELMAMVELPLREPALQAAAQLDEFCADADIQIGINVISQGQVFSGTKLRALAEAAGMVIDADGRFARCDDEGNVLYVLANQETQRFSPEAMRLMHTHGVTFLLDVPRVANGDRVLTQMFDHARRFAESLGGALVDDNRRPLSERAIEPIRRQVVQHQTAMAHNHLPAGGALALRLFS